MLLVEYIDRYYGGNKAAFARAVGVPKQRITEWIAAGYIVHDGALYSKRRELPEP